MTAMNQPHIVVDVSPSGSVTVDAKCFSGSGCGKATEQIEIVLGGGASKTKKKKPEFHAPAAGGKATNKLTF